MSCVSKMALVCALSLTTTLAGAESTAVDWNNGGKGDFPDATPPPSFDGATGTNIKWKTKLPNWSNSSPIVVDTARGPRVVLLAEPVDGYAPLLLCIDADSGKELWRRELDAVPLLPAEVQAEARKVAERGWAAARLRKALTAEITALAEENRDAWKDRNNLPPEAAPILEKAKTAGLEFCGLGASAGGYANYIHPSRGGQFAQDHKRLRELGLMWSDWDYQGTWDGVAYPTPISDGQRIWTVTSHNLYSCHDMEGNVLWQVRFAPPQRSDLTPEQAARLKDKDGRMAWPFGWPGAGNFSTSPLMVDGKLLSTAGSMLRCFDAATGRVLWAEPVDGSMGQNMAVPGLATLGGERYIVVPGGEGRVADGDGIYRVRDGKRVGMLPGIASSKGCNSGPVIHDDVVVNLPSHNEGRVLQAYRLKVQGDGVTAELLWGPIQGVNMFRPCWRDGKLYSANGSVLHIAAGMVDVIPRPRHGGGYAGNGGLLIGNAFLTWNFYEGTFVWSDMATGAILGEGAVPTNPEDGMPLALKREQACLNYWRWLGAATPFAYKDRFYIRSYDFLWCIAPDLDAEAAMQRVGAADEATRLKMATEEPNTELCAAAIRVLGVGTDQPGGQAVRAQIAAVAAQGSWEQRNHADRPAGKARQRLGLLLRTLGADAAPTAVAVLKDGDQKMRETVAAGILWGDLPRRDDFREALIPLLTDRAISVDLGASVLALWPNDSAVIQLFSSILNDPKYAYAQPAAFGYLLPLQDKNQVTAFLANVAEKTPHDRVRGDAVTALVGRQAFDVLGQLLAAATGRQQGALFWPLCHAARTPEAKAFTVAQMKQKLVAGANPAELNINALPALGADAGPLLPRLKAIRTENAGFQKQIADIIAQIEAMVKAAGEKK